MRKTLVLMAFLPLAALAAEDPETVYGKLHQATLAGSVEGVMSHATFGKRKEIASLPGREDMVRMMAMTLPRTYSVTRRDVGARKAHLELRGVRESSGPAWGSADLVKEKGVWKVEEWSWDGALAQATPPKAEPMTATPLPPQEEPKPAASEPPATTALIPVEAPTLRRTTEAELPCVIKPVMSDDDLRRCGATPPKYDN
jgi:hypothetical protein